VKPAVAQVLPSKQHHVRPTLTGVKQQCQGEASPRSYSMVNFKAFDFLIRPGVEALGVAFKVFNVIGRISCDVSIFNCKRVDGAP
jgi:hypothetical protein